MENEDDPQRSPSRVAAALDSNILTACISRSPEFTGYESEFVHVAIGY
jgi:hypothetical protein